jgi:23S rRNA (adenine2503-C2)-methyltransferase
MELIAQFGDENIAKVYVLKLRTDGLKHCIECVESVQPPNPRSYKWVLLVSTLYGCPIGCPMCDAGGSYFGKLTADEIVAQILFLIHNRFGFSKPPFKIPVRTLKIQFARMGEPALNSAVIDVLERLPSIIASSRIIPSISTVAPRTSVDFFERLVEVKNRLYRDGNFQLQFSIHTTDETARDIIIPIKKWDFQTIAEYGRRWFKTGDRKVTLNFAASTQYPIEPSVLRKYFDPELFFIKITPLNPTENAFRNRLKSLVDPCMPESYRTLVQELEDYGYEVLVSIGELRENLIGSNCGQYLTYLRESNLTSRDYKSLSSMTNSPFL